MTEYKIKRLILTDEEKKSLKYYSVDNSLDLQDIYDIALQNYYKKLSTNSDEIIQAALSEGSDTIMRIKTSTIQKGEKLAKKRRVKFVHILSTAIRTFANENRY